MPFRNAMILFVLCFPTPLVFAQQGRAVQQQALTTPAVRSVQMSEEDARAVRDELARMKSLVQQMEVNLAFATPSETPLKHQFQLEIDMWKTVIAEMERRVPATNAH
jgi:hypothetical protein